MPVLRIDKATSNDAQLLSEIATQSFLESHGHSAKPEIINAFKVKAYGLSAFNHDLSDPGNIHHIIYYDERPAGYSKIILNSPYTDSPIKNITKLERLYLLKEFYDLKLGNELFQFNLSLSKQNGQAGMWLYVWKENQRALKFYQKNGFVIIGSYDFQLSPTHSNPNHQMLLKY